MKVSAYCAVAGIAAMLSAMGPAGAYADFTCRIADPNGKGGYVTVTGSGLPVTGNRAMSCVVGNIDDLEDAFVNPRRPSYSGCLANEACSARCPANC